MAQKIPPDLSAACVNMVHRRRPKLLSSWNRPRYLNFELDMLFSPRPLQPPCRQRPRPLRVFAVSLTLLLPEQHNFKYYAQPSLVPNRRAASPAVTCAKNVPNTDVWPWVSFVYVSPPCVYPPTPYRNAKSFLLGTSYHLQVPNPFLCHILTLLTCISLPSCQVGYHSGMSVSILIR
jgi:hypothetical protein